VRQFEIWWRLCPHQAGRRPGLLLSRNDAYQYLGKFGRRRDHHDHPHRFLWRCGWVVERAAVALCRKPGQHSHGGAGVVRFPRWHAGAIAAQRGEARVGICSGMGRTELTSARRLLVELAASRR